MGYAAVYLAHNVQSFIPPGVEDIFRYRKDRCDEAIQSFHEVGDERGVAFAMWMLSTCYGHDDAIALLDTSVTICRRVGDVSGVIRALEALGTRMCVRGDRDGGIQLKLEGLRLAQSSNDEEAMAKMCDSLAISSDEGSAEQGVWFAEAQGLYRARQEWGLLYRSLIVCAELACGPEESDREESCLRQALAVCREIGDNERESMCLAKLARYGGEKSKGPD